MDPDMDHKWLAVPEELRPSSSSSELARYSFSCCISHWPNAIFSSLSHSMYYGLLLKELLLAKRSMNFSLVGA